MSESTGEADKPPKTLEDGRRFRDGFATDQAIRAITDMILSGEVGPGNRLPTERALAAGIGLSRNTVREAVRALELMRVLDVRQGDGTYVTSLEPRLLLESTAFATRLFREERWSEIFDVRRVLEASASAAAAARMTQAELEHLGRLLESICTADTPIALLDADIAFHNFIADCGGNELLASLVRTFSARTYRARFWRSRMLDRALMASMRTAHERIYRAIAARDPDAAASAATVHIIEVMAELERMAEGQDGVIDPIY